MDILDNIRQGEVPVWQTESRESLPKGAATVERYGVQQRRASAVCCNALFDSDVVVLPETDVIGNTVTHQVHLGIPPDAG
jgi:hypothetical protein